MMTLAKRRALRPDRELRCIVAGVRDVAASTRSEAYRFERLADGSVVEVRARDGRAWLTALDVPGGSPVGRRWRVRHVLLAPAVAAVGISGLGAAVAELVVR